ncbi:hypothetical protein QBC38DRAFT_449440 [Podospora fimiseda]|uniref:Uncharacterized protein n=1 Tax=Podospora fimiseda TaxID=252190 RepID=A0AAN6YLV9_9PEZI|nr:hypothetical protein QBC38DRAFT_449440 [Podospora fimiseda]
MAPGVPPTFSTSSQAQPILFHTIFSFTNHHNATSFFIQNIKEKQTAQSSSRKKKVNNMVEPNIWPSEKNPHLIWPPEFVTAFAAMALSVEGNDTEDLLEFQKNWPQLLALREKCKAKLRHKEEYHQIRLDLFERLPQSILGNRAFGLVQTEKEEYREMCCAAYFAKRIAKGMGLDMTNLAIRGVGRKGDEHDEVIRGWIKKEE